VENGFLTKAKKSHRRLVLLNETKERTFLWRNEWEYFLETLTLKHIRNFKSGLSRWLFLIKEKGPNSNLESDAIALWNDLFKKDFLEEKQQLQILAHANWLIEEGNTPLSSIVSNESQNHSESFSIVVYQVEPNVQVFSVLHQQNWELVFGRNAFVDFAMYLPLIEVGQKISLFHFSPDGNRLIPSDHSRMILDPDVLFSVTDVSEVFGQNGQKWKAFFGNKLKIEKFSIPLLIGNLANDLLDQMVVEGRFDAEWIQETIRSSLLKNKLQAALFDQVQLKDLVSKIQNQIAPNLIEFVQRIRKGSKDIRIEPTFVSVADGLTGRLDLLLENESGAMDIIELKSGKAPAGWLDLKHEVQTILYYRLIQQTYGEQAAVSGAILYASSSDRPLRNLNVNQIYPYLIQADEARNFLLLTCKKLASFQLSEVHQAMKSLEPDFESLRSSFGLMKIQTVLEGYQSMGNFPHANALKAYYLGMFSMQMREWLSLKLGDFQSGVHRKNNGAASIWLESSEEKQDKFSMIHSAKLIEIKDEMLVFQFQPWPHPFRLCGPVQLTACDENGKPIPLKEQWIRGVVFEQNEGIICIRPMAKSFSTHYLESIPFFNIEEVFLDSNIWATLKSLSNLFPTTANERSLSLLLGEEQPTFAKLEFESKERSDLAVEMALAANDYFLIQGPPGTGKTSKVLTKIVKNFCELEEKTLVLAFTNRAVEEIVTKLKKQEIDYFSLRSEEADSYDSVQAYSDALKGSNVFLSTIASFTARFPDFLSIAGSVKNLIVDEASQVTESQLAGIIPLFERFILIGDHQQLPPVVSQDIQLNDLSKLKSVQVAGIRTAMEKLEEVGLFGRWTDSIFERLWFLNDRNGWPAIVTLDTHYRMHEEIAQAISSHYLPTQLRVGNDFQLEGWSCEDDWTNLSQHRRLVFVENRGMDRGKVNRSEAEDVARIAVHLIGRKQEQQEWTDFLGIITPWRAQIEEIKRAIFKLREELGIEVELEKLINIDTVERFQGSEADYILFSTCVNGENYLEALTSTEQNGVDRKLLVAISRARKQMILLGKSDFLKLSTPYSQLLDYIEQNGAWLVMD
jgi:hypothetical protein